MTKHLLIADDDASIRQSIRLILNRDGYQFSEVATAADAVKHVMADKPDALLLDIHFGSELSGLNVLEMLKQSGVTLPIVVLSGAASPTEAVQAIQLGAFDFIEKPLSRERLKLSLERAMQFFKLQNSVESFSTQSAVGRSILGNSEVAKKLRADVDLYAPKEVRVLITGETGTGKEVIAHLLWQQSKRNDKPFVILNASAIPDNLVESELFGHQKGSFTGAVRDHVGKIELAHKGTLFLDEIGDLSLTAQTKLLRFLETGEIQKIGSSKNSHADVRIFAATSRDLEAEVHQGRFRADLFYRLNVARIHVDPLRRRTEDIDELFSFFIGSFASKCNESPKKILPESIDALRTYSWPGNIRELRNVVERLVINCAGVIEPADVYKALGHKVVAADKASGVEYTLQPFKTFKAESERRYIEWALERCHGSVTKTAAALKIDRSYLHQKISTLRIKVKDD